MIFEKLGVPDGINKQAEKLYNEFISDLDNYEIPEDFNDDVVIGNYDISIKDMNIKNVPFVIKHELVRKDLIKDATLLSANFSSITAVDISSKKAKFKTDNIDSYFLSIVVAVTEETKKENIINTFKKDLSKDIIAHELMHMYDNYKKGSVSLEDSAEYISFKSQGFPTLISDFFHLLYYVTSIENVVRPAELYQKLIDNNIKKSEFKDFIENEKIIKMLRKAKNFSLDEFKSELESDSEVNSLVSMSKSDGYERVGSVSDDALNLIMINIINVILKMNHEFLNINMFNDPLFLLVADDEFKTRAKKSMKQFNDILRKYLKYENNPQKYFEYLEKRLNFVGDKMIKKLYKLYDMVEEKNTNSIINWELKNKISKNKIVYTLDFKSWKNTK